LRQGKRARVDNSESCQQSTPHSITSSAMAAAPQSTKKLSPPHVRPGLRRQYRSDSNA
jgi:hypothetical protein